MVYWVLPSLEAGLGTQASPIGAIAAALALAGTLALSTYAFRSFSAANARVEHTALVKGAIGNLLETLLDAETGQRGFLLTGTPDYLEPYRAARARFEASLSALRTLTADNPRQQGKLVEIERDARLKLAELERSVEVRSSQGFAGALAIVQTNEGKRTMDALRRELGEMGAEEDRLLEERRHAQARDAVLLISALAVTSALFGLLLVLVSAAQRTAAARERSSAAEAAQLRSENERLAERARTNEFQERFIAILGHDLRNPLASFTTGLALLKQSPPAAQPKTLERMKSSAARMARMVEQLLDLARSRLGGGIPIVPAPADLGELVGGVAEELRSAYPQGSVVVDAAKTAAGVWDAARLEQVVSNLVGNALSHGASDGPVRVTVRGEGEQVVLSVHNGGPAIPEELRTVLFEPFRRGEREAVTQRTAGLGLGLYISNEIVRAHGGTLQVESSDGDGTTFTVRLPRDVRAPPREDGERA